MGNPFATAFEQRQGLTKISKPIGAIDYRTYTQQEFRETWWPANGALFVAAATAKWNGTPAWDTVSTLIGDIQMFNVKETANCKWLVSDGPNGGRGVAVVNANEKNSEGNTTHAVVRYLLTNGVGGMGTRMMTAVLQWSERTGQGGLIRLTAQDDFLEGWYQATYGFAVTERGKWGGPELSLDANNSNFWHKFLGTWNFA